MPQHAEILRLLSECDRLALLDPALALRCVEEAYFLLVDCKPVDVDLLARLTLPYTRLLFSFGRTDESLALLFQALTQSDIESQDVMRESLLQEIALTYYTLGDYQEAGEYWTECLTQDSFSDVAKLNAHIGMGMIQFAYGEIEQSLAQHQSAIALLDSQMPPLLHARAWINLAAAFFQLNQWHESQHALVRAYPYAQQASAQEFIGEIYLYMAKIALETNNLDAAALRLAQAKASCKEWRWGDVMQQLLQGRIFLASEQLDKAISCFKNALEQSLEMGFARQVMDAHHLLSMAYQRAGNKELAEYEYGCYQTACIRLKVPARVGDCSTKSSRLGKPALEFAMLHCA
jgi:tetratricopeptide (TPR) repeat protein